jgi:hypothetical protein
VLAKRRASFGQGGAARRSREQLNAQELLKSRKPSADERFGNAKPARCLCDAGGVSNLHEGAQFLNIHWCFLLGDMVCQFDGLP